MFTFGSAPKRHVGDQIEDQDEVPEDRYQVVHDKVAVRSSADTKAPALSALTQGKYVTGECKQVDGSPWLRLSRETCSAIGIEAEHAWAAKGVSAVRGEDYGHPKAGDKFTKKHLAKAQETSSVSLDEIVLMGFVDRKEAEAWVLIDGKSVGLGLLLKEAPLQESVDVTVDIVKWANANPFLKKRDDEALQSLLDVAKKQVDVLRPALQSAAALSELKQAKLLADNDVSRGEDAIAKCILEKLLLRRLGESEGLAFVHWEEDKFDAYVREIVLPLAPYRCRSFTPARVERVLVLLHGAEVTGDDLVDEAEVLQRLLPETAVVLPEGACLLNEELGLRAWWPPPATRAPAAAVRRLVATVHSVLRRSGGAALLLGGFSQGSMLLVQSLGALHRDGVAVRGLFVLSGLVEPFEFPSDTRCLVVHGGKDAKIPVESARLAVRQMEERPGGTALNFLEIADLAHEISDDELERIAAFCNDAAPVAEQRVSSAEKQAQDAEQAKLLRYVRRMADGLQMYDKDWFMVHICDLKMIGLGPESPALGGGVLRYHMHDAGPESNGLVVLFHGMVSNLRKETDPLALAYLKALRISVCVVDYRQRTSCFNVDAQMCLEELESLSGSSSKPVIVHGIGLGATLAIHMAMASQVMPAEVCQRLRLLVLDGAMGAIHMNVGCTTKDPIGNDSKLAYVRMPLCVLGGDDKLCGLTVGDTQWNQVSQLAEDLRQAKKISALTVIPDSALKHEGSKQRNLHPQLYQAVDAALGASQDASKEQRGKDFIEDVLNVSEEFAGEKPENAIAAPWVPRQGTSPKEQLEAIGKSMMEAASSRKVSLTDASALQEPRRSEELLSILLAVASPLLRAHGGFKEGVEGLRQLEAAFTTVSEFFPDLQQLQQKVDKLYDLGILHRVDEGMLAKVSRNAAGQEESDRDAGGVKVVVKHMTKGGSLTLAVPETATIMDVRRVLMEKLKESNLNKVKLVTPAAKGTKMIPDGEPLNGRTELLMVGRPLD